MVHTRSLWISEGITDYYAAVALARTGIFTPQDYLDHMGRVITALEQSPGRKERSIADTSWDTWFGGGGGGFGAGAYSTNLVNTNYSYYDGGNVLGLLLDLEIRHATQNRKSLDDWMRLMYQRYALPKPGFEPGDAVRAASEVAGTDMTSFSLTMNSRPGPASRARRPGHIRRSRRIPARFRGSHEPPGPAKAIDRLLQFEPDFPVDLRGAAGRAALP